MPKKQSAYIVRFQFREGVDEAICRNPVFARRKLEQLGTLHPNKDLVMIISGTEIAERQFYRFPAEEWESYLEKITEATAAKEEE